MQTDDRQDTEINRSGSATPQGRPSNADNTSARPAPSLPAPAGEMFANAQNPFMPEGTFSIVGRDQNVTTYANAPPPTLRQLLKPVDDAAYNCNQSSNDKCQEGTRVKLVKTIKKWADSRGDRRPICWLNGPAGFGKSAVTRTIAERLDHKKRLAGSFFFFRGAGRRSEFTNFIPTLAYQISCSTPAVKTHLLRSLEHQPDISSRPIGYQLTTLVIDPIIKKRCKFHLPLFRKPMVIIVDGLDESDDRASVQAFITDLANAYKRHPKLVTILRFFIASRVEEHIQRAFDDPEVLSAIYRLSLADDRWCTALDIRAFLTKQFDATFVKNSRLFVTSWPLERDLETLASMAENSFIFAATLCKYVSGDSNSPPSGSTPQKRLQQILNSDQSHRLDALYTQVLSQASENAGDLQFTQGRVLSTFILLNHPVSVSDLSTILVLDTEDIIQALLGLQSILMIPGTNQDHIQAFHTSIRDFLLDKMHSGGFFVGTDAAYLDVAASCLRLISGKKQDCRFLFDKGPENIAYLWHTFVKPDSVDLQLLTFLLDKFFLNSFDAWLNTVIFNDNSKFGEQNELPDNLSNVMVCFPRIEEKIQKELKDWMNFMRELEALARRGFALGLEAALEFFEFFEERKKEAIVNWRNDQIRRGLK